ncbi:DcaP family trimeric outer membrane transporter [Marinobacter sp. X15-166B]|uniref:DcaP family trimeric outer membrane transporter n=1 Tax=Marinobacter sp. X15-166B TaxID=1897620 RepID=UPI00085BD39E|nr:DcaP family trimeric outer membrane transporter [Marinobacter sp. X15-166B]OEY65595.1 hypothetical protein BG841_03395 [Marinobacter sp. X15-166B]
MQPNNLTMAIRATAGVLAVGLASQAGAFELNTQGIDAELYGYARFNASYDINADIANSTRSGSFSALNSANQDIEGHFGADAFQTRFGVRAGNADGVKFNIEGDFRGGGGGTLRLRHGYGSYKGVLMGQTWSNFNSFVGNTSVLDFDGLAGSAGFQGRKAQVRYTTGALSFSAEDMAPGGIIGGTTREALPAFTARIEDSSGGMSYSAALLAHQVTSDNGSNDDSAIGYAAFVAGKMAVTSALSIQGALNYSDGANAYLYRSGENFGAEDGYMNGTSLETIAGYGGTIGMGLDLGNGRSVNIGYGIVTVDWDDAEKDLGAAAVAGKSETNQNAMINYMWTPVQNVMMGVEYAYFDRENQSGKSNDANRIMLAGQYNF